MLMKTENYRQGEVYLVAVDSIPAEAKQREDKVVARGEATGHRHELSGGTVYCDEKGNLFFHATAKRGARLRHQDASGKVAEHADVKVKPGKYKVVIQKEYFPSGWVNVRD
jgi:hypothetical protein